VTPLVVGSYNIHRGVGLDRRRDLDRIARVIGEIAPDVIGLQEVVRENGVAAADQAMYLAARLDMTLVMGETRAFGSAGTYGNAVLTRLPVLSSLRCDLSCDGREPRGCLRVGQDPHLKTGGIFDWDRIARTTDDEILALTAEVASGFSLGRSTTLFPAGAYLSFDRGAQYAVAPDDRRFLMIRQVPGSVPDELVVVDNWFEELKPKQRK